MNIKVLKYITYRRLSDSSSIFFMPEYFLKKIRIKKNIFISTIKNAFLKNNIWLYIHIPFCVTECSYCACFKKKITNDDNISIYVEYISKELFLYYKMNNYQKINFDTIMFWWGTPSILSVNELEKLFNNIYKYINLESIKQISFEISPYSIDFKKIDILKKFWITRISIWLQSFNKSVLIANNRPYVSYNKIKELVYYIKSKNIICVGDIMIWLKLQEFDICINDYKLALDLELDQININYFYSNIFSKYKDTQKSLVIKKKFEKFYNIQKSNFTFRYNLLQEFNLLNKDDYSILWLGIWSISLINRIIFTKNDYLNYYNKIDSNIFPYDKIIFLENEILSLKFVFNSINKNYIDIDFINTKFEIDFLSIFKFEIDFLIKNTILIVRWKKIFFMKNILVTNIYFSVFFLKYIDLKSIENDIKNISEKELDINLLSLIDEI